MWHECGLGLQPAIRVTGFRVQNAMSQRRAPSQLTRDDD
jgi:hypothetical protein